ncbi:MAG: glycosyltransferase [Chitinophagaceae bacterium]|nr:glycosyltransferase [Chitinophagaceae bacterium]
MHQMLLFIQWFIFIFLAVQVGYLLFFSIVGRLLKAVSIPTAKQLSTIRVFIPGYKEDSVIIETARQASLHNYAADKFEVVVIADSFSPATLQVLRALSIKVLEVSFDKSTKGKALLKAIEATINKPVDIALVLDADNVMAPGFLHAVNNAFAAGYQVVQGHRTAKNLQTPFAFLDACTEEINNHIFRRGHVAVGLPSALIGSGMAFNWQLFVMLLQGIGDTSGEDKELEFRIMRANKKIAFLDGAYVYDEKVAHREVFSQQRSRWLAMQLEFFQKYLMEGWVQLFKGNVAFFNKVFQTFLLPRVMLAGLLTGWCALSLLLFPSLLPFNLTLEAALVLSLFLGIPARWFNRQLLSAFTQIPGALLSMVSAMLHMGKAKRQFIHTPHGETNIEN